MITTTNLNFYNNFLIPPSKTNIASFSKFTFIIQSQSSIKPSCYLYVILVF